MNELRSKVKREDLAKFQILYFIEQGSLAPSERADFGPHPLCEGKADGAMRSGMRIACAALGAGQVCKQTCVFTLS